MGNHTCSVIHPTSFNSQLQVQVLPLKCFFLFTECKRSRKIVSYRDATLWTSSGRWDESSQAVQEQGEYCKAEKLLQRIEQHPMSLVFWFWTESSKTLKSGLIFKLLRFSPSDGSTLLEELQNHSVCSLDKIYKNYSLSGVLHHPFGN